MRCLNCHREGIATGAEACPYCGTAVQVMLGDMLPPGTLLCHGAFRIEYPVGQGGYGITYKATDTRLNRTVAIKEFFPKGAAHRARDTGKVIVRTSDRAGTTKALERFAREGRLLAHVSHPNVVRVHQLFEEHDTAYIVMEYLAGRSLREEVNAAKAAMNTARLSEGRVREVIGDIVLALAAVHGAGILHLDIKPENVMLVRDPLRGAGAERCVLIDFGAGRQDTGQISSTSTVYMTVPYAPPELLLRQDLGPESDVFQVGVMLHELLTGKLPPSAMQRLSKDVFTAEGFSEPWKGMLLSALRMERETRPGSIVQWWSAANTATGTVTPPAPVFDKSSTPPPSVSIPAYRAPSTDRDSSSDFVAEATRQMEERRRVLLSRAALFLAGLTGIALLWTFVFNRPVSQQQIDKQKMSVRLQLSNATSQEIADALWRDHKIKVYLTRPTDKYLRVSKVAWGGLPARAALEDLTKLIGARKYEYNPTWQRFEYTPRYFQTYYCGNNHPTTKCPIDNGHTGIKAIGELTEYNALPLCDEHSKYCDNTACPVRRAPNNVFPRTATNCYECQQPLSSFPSRPPEETNPK